MCSLAPELLLLVETRFGKLAGGILGIGGEDSVLKPRMCQIMEAVGLREISIEMGNISIMCLVDAGTTEQRLIRQRESGCFAPMLKPLMLGGGDRHNDK